MFSFSPRSQAQLATCHPDLQRLMNEAIKYMDFSVIEGHRGKEAQEAAFAAHNSEVHYPYGKHNAVPSRAVDIMPYPVDWSDDPKNIQRGVFLAGIVSCCAKQMGIRIRWGGDWNQNCDTRDEGPFRDYPHFELSPMVGG